MFRLDKPLERCSGDYSQSGWLSCLEGVYKERGGGCRFPWEEKEEVKGDAVCSAEATHRRLTSAEEWLWWHNDEVIVKVRNKIQAF